MGQDICVMSDAAGGAAASSSNSNSQATMAGDMAWSLGGDCHREGGVLIVVTDELRPSCHAATIQYHGQLDKPESDRR
jgi:hypothetical protein